MLFYVVDNTVVIALILVLSVTLALIFLSSKSAKVPALGLTVIYFYSFLSNNIPGASLLLIDWYEYLPKYHTYTGFVASAIGGIAFGVGAATVHMFARIDRSKIEKIFVDRDTSEKIQNFSLMLLGMSLLANIAILFLGGIASISALLAALMQLTTVACFIWLWLENISLKSKIGLLFCLVAYPLYMLIFHGFLGFGVTFVASIAIFFVLQRRPNALIVFSLPFAAFLAFSFSVSYLVARTEFREVVWDASNLNERFLALDRLVDRFEWFDKDNYEHLRMVDGRMNQNWLVGVAIESVETGKTEISYGQSLSDAAVSWIPRAIWADKPNTGGSGSLVSDITGLEFAVGTSVGVSHWLELYANFGMWGMVSGMFLLGVVIRTIDLSAGRALRQANIGRFVFMALLGSSFLNNLGSFSESVGSFAASLLAATIVLYVLNQQFPSLVRRNNPGKSARVPFNA